MCGILNKKAPVQSKAMVKIYSVISKIFTDNFKSIAILT